MDVSFLYSLFCLVLVCLAQNREVEYGQSDFTIDLLHYQSVITHRFATTHVTSQLTNVASSAREATFKLRLPKEAFISNFTMTIDGVVYPGVVDEKEKAKKKYEAAIDRGESAGKVEASPRDTNRFVVSVNVGPSENVTFDLVYQELLVRKAGLYEHVIYIDPGMTIPDLWVDVYIFETREITDLSVPQLSNDLLSDVVISDFNPIATVEMLSTSSAHITFIPSIEEQLDLDVNKISNQFIVNYDVDHDFTEAGEILVSNGYFIHYFAPMRLQPMKKRMLFVLDTSGSMSGQKIKQLKTALVTILEDLRPEDEFGILTFSGSVHLWNSGELIPASEENVASGRRYAESLSADGGTNIKDAISRGLAIVSGNPDRPAMLLFLTDGLPTSGITNRLVILENIRRQNVELGVSIFSLAFGQGADYDLVRKISAQNNGMARMIYEDSDASLQLAGFYDEISSPLLSDVKITYIGEMIENQTLTKTDLHCFFDGTEMIIAGKIDLDNQTAPTIDLAIVGTHLSNIILIEEKVNVTSHILSDIPIPTPFEINDFTERLWVYLTVKQLIDTTLQATDLDRVAEAKEKALELSLKYNFVTPYTSMVVTKPGPDDDLKKEVLDDIPLPQPRQESYFLPSYGAPGLPGTQTQLALPIARSSGGSPYFSSMNYHGPAGRTTNVQHSPYRQRSSQSFKLPTVPYPSISQIKGNFPITYPQPRQPSGVKQTTKQVNRQPQRKLPANKRRKYSKKTESHKMISYDWDGSPNTVRSYKYPPALSLQVKFINKAQKKYRTNTSLLCFDIPKRVRSRDVLHLVRDNKTELSVEGRPSSVYEDGRKFEEVSVADNTTHIRVTAKGVHYQSGPVVPWWQLKHVNKTGLRALPKGGVEITLGNGFSLVVTKHGIQSRRSRARPFLTILFSNTDGLSKHTTGIIGDILKLRITVTKNARMKYRTGGVTSRTEERVALYDMSGIGQCYRVDEKKYLMDLINM